MIQPTGPSERVRRGVDALNSLGQAIVAARGNGFSANILGVPTLGRDGNEVVISLDNCGCHLHVEWELAHGFKVETDDVGYGPEPVVLMVDGAGETMLRFYYPRQSLKKIKGALRGVL